MNISFIRSSWRDSVFCCPKSSRMFDDSLEIIRRSSSAEVASLTCLMNAWQDLRMNGTSSFFNFFNDSFTVSLILSEITLMNEIVRFSGITKESNSHDPIDVEKDLGMCQRDSNRKL